MQRIMAVSETSNEYQPSAIKFVKIPEYMSTFKSRPVDASFLGGTIVSKVCKSFHFRLHMGLEGLDLLPNRIIILMGQKFVCSSRLSDILITE